MKRFGKKGLVLLAWSCHFCFLSFSTAQPKVEHFQPGARSLALGGSLVAQARDPAAIFWNPAILSGFRDRELLISINDPFQFNFVGLTQFVPLYGAMGVALSRIPTDSAGVDRGTFAWGVKMLERFSLGANFSLSKQNDDWFAHGSAALFLGNPGVGALGRRWNDIPTPHLLDRLNLGLIIHNIPIGGKLFDPSANFGVSYLFPTPGLLINTGHHFRNGDDASHLGFGIEVFQTVAVFGGIDELDFGRAAIGMSYSHDNFLVDISYSFDSERFVLTLAPRISPAPAALARPYYERGTKYWRSKNYHAAYREIRKYLSFELSDSASVSARNLISRIEKKLAWERVQIDSLFGVANQIISQGQPYIGYAAYPLTRILELDSTNTKARKKLSQIKPVVELQTKKDLEEGRAAFDAKHYEKAIRAFTRVLLLDKKNQTALNYMASIRQIFNNLGEEHLNRGIGYFQQKNYERARLEFKTALQYKRDLEQAKTFLSRIEEKIKEVGEQVQEMLAAGEALERKGSYVGAADVYLKVLELDPENAAARARLDHLRPNVEQDIQKNITAGANYLKDKKFADARASFSKVLAIDPNHKEARSYMQRLREDIKEEISKNLASASEAMQKGDWRRAEELYSEVLKLDSQNSHAIQGKQEAQAKLEIDVSLANAVSAMSQGNYKQAIFYFEKVLQLDFNNEKAADGLKTARAKLEEQVERLFIDGISEYSLDRYQEAIKKWKEVLILDPNHKGATEYIQQAEERIEALKKLKK